jgi:chromosome segregation ATPase
LNSVASEKEITAPVTMQVRNTPNMVNSHGTEGKAPVTMQFRNTQDMAKILFPTSSDSNVNVQHMHEGLMNHSMAINTMLTSMQKSTSDAAEMHNALSWEMEQKHNDVHHALVHHTDVMNGMVDTHARMDGGLHNHKKHIEEIYAKNNELHGGLVHHTDVLNQVVDTHSRMHEGLHDHKNKIESVLSSLMSTNTHLEKHWGELKKQQEQLSSFQNLFDNQRETHATALENHTDVLRKHVTTLGDHKLEIDTHAQALLNHRDVLRSQNRRLDKFDTSMQETHEGLMGHRKAFEKTEARQTASENKIKAMSDVQLQILKTQENINLQLKGLENSIKTNNQTIVALSSKTDSVMNPSDEIGKIKKAVNDNASILESLYRELGKENAR